ncbi:MAG: MATE family efflux transporter [Omnitrophica WOR_2 bacterium]|jgi:putative MATE family efflux protein
MINDKALGYKRIWQISYPIILSLIAQNAVNVTDTAFLGRVGEVELGASAIGGLFYISLFMLGFGFSIGGQILIARKNGEQKYEEIGKITDNSIYFLMSMGVILFLIIYFLGPFILRPLISSDEIYRASVEFTKYRIYGIFFAFGNVLLRAFYIGTIKTKILTFNAIILAGTNIILDYCLIFGNFGFPEMGLKGAALASSIAEAVSAIFFFSYTFKFVDLKKYRLFLFGPLDWKVIKSTFNISVFVMLQTFLSLSGWLIFFMIVEKMGERSLAISNIIRSIYIVLLIPVMALGSTTNTLVSNLIGEGKSEKVILAVKRVAKMNFMLIAGLVIIVLIIPKIIISVYTNDISLVNDTVPVLYVIVTALTFFSFSNILFNAVSGTERTEIALIIEVITISIYLIYAYFLVEKFKVPIYGVWTAEMVYFVLLGTFSFLYLRSGHWKLNKNLLSFRR